VSRCRNGQRNVLLMRKLNQDFPYLCDLWMQSVTGDRASDAIYKGTYKDAT
jgi:hypothetical protein